jgi:hypothetical protein
MAEYLVKIDVMKTVSQVGALPSGRGIVFFLETPFFHITNFFILYLVS